MENTLAYHYDQHEGFYNLCVFILGLVNNLGYFVINAFVGQLAADFDKNYFFGVYIIFLNAVACIARFSNAIFFMRIQHGTRIMINSVLMIFSFMLLAIAMLQYQGVYTSFYLCIIASLTHGFAQAFGEGVLLGYLKGLPSDLVMTFGSGTGIAGFSDAFTMIFLNALGVAQGRSFLILGLFVLPYYFSFLWIDDKRKTYIKNELMYPELQVSSPVRSDGLFAQYYSPQNTNKQIFEFNESAAREQKPEQEGQNYQQQINERDQEIQEEIKGIVVYKGENDELKFDQQEQHDQDQEYRQSIPEGESDPQQVHRMRKCESKMLKEYDDVSDNKRLSLVSSIQVFQKAGSYIYNMGLVNFFEYLVINLTLTIHVYNKQTKAQQMNQEMSFFEENEYSFLMIAYYAGSFISRSTLHSAILSKSYTPTIAQAINLTIWIYNLQYSLFTSFYPVFFFMIWCGFPGGTAYSNFLYLANTRTNLECDFQLHYTERELTVNLLMISNDLGVFFAGVINLAVQALYFPDVLDNPPS